MTATTAYQIYDRATLIRRIITKQGQGWIAFVDNAAREIAILIGKEFPEVADEIDETWHKE